MVCMILCLIYRKGHVIISGKRSATNNTLVYKTNNYDKHKYYRSPLIKKLDL